MIEHRIPFEDIDRETDSWERVLRIVDDNFDRVVFRVEHEGFRCVVERFRVAVASAPTFTLAYPHEVGRNRLTVYVDGVRMFPGRDFRENGPYVFDLSVEAAYRSVVTAVYLLAEHPVEASSVPGTVVDEYGAASLGFQNPRERVLAEVDSIVHGIMTAHQRAEDLSGILFEDYGEMASVLEYMEGYEAEGRFEPGDYYLLPRVGSDGNVYWTKSMPSIELPPPRTFAHRGSIEENSIFVGAGRDALARQVVGSGVVLHDPGSDPEYGRLPLSAGGTGQDNDASGSATGLLVLDGGTVPPPVTNLPAGVFMNGSAASGYDPGVSVGTLTDLYGGTGRSTLAAAISASGIPTSAPLRSDLLDRDRLATVSVGSSAYRDLVGRRFLVRTLDPAFGEVSLVVVGIGSADGEPEFTLMADRPVTDAPLSLVTDGRYRTYDLLEGLSDALASFRRALPADVLSRLREPFDVLLDDLERVETGVLNPSSDSVRDAHSFSVSGELLWIPSLSDADTGSIDRLVVPDFYDYFSESAMDRIMDVVGSGSGMWTRSQALSEDVPRYAAYMADGTIASMPVDARLGVVPLARV